MQAMQWAAKSVCGMVVYALLAVVPTPASAATIQVNFTGLDLVYDGSALYDAGSTAGGFADPADADPLISAVFSVDGMPVGSLLTDISADIFIPGLTGIPSGANQFVMPTTSGDPGFFDLLIGTSPLASQFLLVDLGEVEITYDDDLGVAQFLLGAAVSDVFAQNLPFGLVVDEPLTVSFSATVVPGTLTEFSGFIDGFSATGIGEISEQGAAVIPEPAAALLLALGCGALLAQRRRKAGAG
jgi:hypothetical protein